MKTTPSQRKFFRARPEFAGFTLVELLVVMALMVIMVGLVAPAVNNIGQANSLSGGGRLVGNLLTIARSEAINQRTRVQLRIVTKLQSGTDDLSVHYRKMSLWKLAQSGASGSYVPISKWETLPDGVLFEPSLNPLTKSAPSYVFASGTSTFGTYFLNTNTLNNPNPSSGSTPVTIGAGNYNYVWIEFSPTGGTTMPIPPSTVSLLLVEGIMPSTAATTPTYTSKGKVSGSAAITNWLQVSINCLTGTTKIKRP